MGQDVVQRDAGEEVALWLGGAGPDGLREGGPVGDPASTIKLYIADDQDQDGIVGDGLPEATEHIPHEWQPGIQLVTVVEGGVHGCWVDAQEPHAQPVVVAVLDDAQVGGAGDHQARSIGEGSRPERFAGSRPCIAGVTLESDPAAARQAPPKEAIELGRQAPEEVPLWRLKAGPGNEVPDVPGCHAEGVGHHLGEVAGAPAVQNPGDGAG